MLTLRQTKWFSFSICCLFNSPLHNLKKNCINGKLLCDSFISIMRTKASRAKRRLQKKIKRQMMAALTNSNSSNTAILNADSTKETLPNQTSSDSSSSISRECSQEEENTRTRRKESIKSDNKSNNDPKSERKNPSKQSNACGNIVQQTSNQSIPVHVSHHNSNMRPDYNAYMWPHSYDSAIVPQNLISYPRVFYRTFSDTIDQMRFHMHLNNGSSSYNYNNRYHMRRSNIPESSNWTNVATQEKQFALSVRSWENTAFGKKFGNRASDPLSCNFTIMSYNVLAQELLTEHSYLYRNHNPRALLWKERWSNLLQEIKHHEADILCLQEVQTSHLETNYAELKRLGYEGLFKQRTGIRTDGCAIYYKTSKLNLIEHTTVEFNQSSASVLDRDNIAIIAKFSHKQNEENQFVVATTHLLYNPRREDVRLAQTQVLLSEIDRMSYSIDKLGLSSHLPIILTGDFNLSPNSPVYELITRGILEYEHLTNKSLARANTNTSFPIATGKLILPPSLRITDECQHADLVEKRNVKGSISRQDELQLIQLQHSERTTNSKCFKKSNKYMFSTGTLSHHLALQSAYEHRHGNAVEGTTFQDKWITVDYIFYSGIRDENHLVKENKLKLVSRYTIPTMQQLEGLKIPNYGFGSDHISLVVKFKLDP